MRTITITAVTALALGLGTLTACTNNPEPTPTATPTVVATTPSMSTSPSPPSSPSESPSPTPSPTLDADQLAAQNIINEFFRLTEELMKNPELPLQPLADITTGRTQERHLKSVADYRAMNAIQIGDATWDVLSVSQVSDQEGEKTAVVEVCTDNSAVDVINQQTKESVLPSDRSTTIRWTMEALAENGVWRVSDLSTTPVEGCPK